MKWQDVRDLGLNLFKKKSRSRRLWIGAGSLSFLGVLGYLILLTGVTITTSGDVFCDEMEADCTNATIYANITSTYWEICFNDTDFAPLYFDKQPLNYDVFVPTRGKDNWRPLEVGDCIKRKNKYNVLPNRFKIEIQKNSWETIKYGVKFGLTDLDPFIYGSNVEIINGVKYEKYCNEVYTERYEHIQMNCSKIETSGEWEEHQKTVIEPINASCEDQINATHCSNEKTWYEYVETIKNITYTCNRKEIVNVSIGCKANGTILIDDTKLIDLDGYFCGTDKNGIICDEGLNSKGQWGDGNGDGKCQGGETCIRQ